MTFDDVQRKILLAWTVAAKRFCGPHKKKAPSFHVFVTKTFHTFEALQPRSRSTLAKQHFALLEMALTMARLGAQRDMKQNPSKLTRTQIIDQLLLWKVEDADDGAPFTSYAFNHFHIVARAILNRCIKAELLPHDTDPSSYSEQFRQTALRRRSELKAIKP